MDSGPTGWFPVTPPYCASGHGLRTSTQPIGSWSGSPANLTFLITVLILNRSQSHELADAQLGKTQDWFESSTPKRRPSRWIFSAFHLQRIAAPIRRDYNEAWRSIVIHKFIMLIAGALLLTLSTTALGSSTGAEGVQRCSNGAQSVETNGRGIEVLEGVEAKRHLENLMSRRPAAWARAKADLLARGFTPTDIVVVHRSIRQVKGPAAAREPHVQLASETQIQDSDGEIVFWSWDDGDDSTWEGSMYMSDYEYSSEALSNTQLWIADEESHYPLWEENIYYDGGTTPGPIDKARINHARDGIQLVSFSSGGNFKLVQSSVHRLVQDWGWCAASMCGGAILGCRATGPKYPVCVKFNCSLGAISCGIFALYQAGQR